MEKYADKYDEKLVTRKKANGENVEREKERDRKYGEIQTVA